MAAELLEMCHTNLIKHRLVLKPDTKLKNTEKDKLSYREREWLVAYLAKLEKLALLAVQVQPKCYRIFDWLPRMAW